MLVRRVEGERMGLNGVLINVMGRPMQLSVAVRRRRLVVRQSLTSRGGS